MTAATIFTNYGAVIVEFLCELYVLCFMMSHRLSRKNKFWLRLAVSTGAILALGIAFAVLYTVCGDTVWGRTLIYLLLFALLFGQFILLFDAPVWTMLFCVSAAYTLQNLAYKIYLFQYYFGKLAGIYDFRPGVVGQLLFRLMYYTVYAAILTAMWFIAVRRMSIKLSMEKLNYKIFIISLIIVAVSVLLCSMLDLWFEEAGLSVWESGLQPTVLFAIRQADNALSIICSITVLILMAKTLEEGDLQRKVEQLQHAIRQGEQQYHISKATINMINIKCHDMKYKLEAAVGGSGIASDALEDLRRSIAIYDANIETGNTLLNVLFTEKSLYCEKHGITLSCMIDGSQLSFMSDGDLYCLFGNIADNALEAVTKIKQREKRIINVMVKAQKNMVLVQQENFFTGELKTENGLPVTTKEDKAYHGFGMSSMKMIVQKYGGEMIINTEGDIFKLTLLFPEAH